jgi:hypothetical protein
MQRRPHSPSGHSAFHLALIAFACAVMALLGGSSPARFSAADAPARQIHDHVEQIKAPNHSTVRMARLDAPFAEDLPGEWAELADAEEDDQTNEDATAHYIRRSDLPAFASPTGLHEASAVPAALPPFRLLAFSSCAPPSA